eukprot:COSAG06_NODE_943_length_11375_cov_11.840635_9_plen_90_part_00
MLGFARRFATCVASEAAMAVAVAAEAEATVVAAAAAAVAAVASLDLMKRLSAWPHGLAARRELSHPHALYPPVLLADKDRHYRHLTNDS